jgi:hypothetical protein
MSQHIKNLPVEPASAGPRMTTDTAPGFSKWTLASAVLGVLYLAVEFYALLAWVLSGDARPTPSGPSRMPDLMAAIAVAGQIVLPLVFVAAIWLIVVRPARRVGRLTVDGVYFLVLTSLFWQDPTGNYVRVWTTYNSALVNWGSWAEWIPGWRSPDGAAFPEPLLLVVPTYGIALFGCAVGANKVMRAAHQRWNIGPLGLCGIALGIAVGVDLIVEPLVYMPLGWFVYPGAIQSMSLFPGHYYQFPLYEALVAGAWFSSYAILRYFRYGGDGKRTNEVIRLESASRRVRVTQALSLIGVCNLLFLIFTVPVQPFVVHSDDWPSDITKRSYLTSLCDAASQHCDAETR